MRITALSGLAALAAVLGCVLPAAATPASAAPVPLTANGITTRGLEARAAAATLDDDALPAGTLSCSSPTFCFVIGEESDKNGEEYLEPRALKGSVWEKVTVPQPKGMTAYPAAVSCVSSACLVVGADGTDTTSLPYAALWNGSKLTELPAPPLPKGVTDVELIGVKCFTAKNCVAVGVAFPGGVGPSNSQGSPVQRALVEGWNGSKWTLRAESGVVSSTAMSVSLDSSSCASASFCVLVGEVTTLNTKTGAFASDQVAYEWNGATVAAMKLPTPMTSNAFLTLYGVSCATTKSCAAVGVKLSGLTTNPASGDLTAFDDVWNGATWAAVTLDWPKGTTQSALSDVSCPAAGTCETVGAAGPSEKDAAGIALGWHGKAWVAQKIPAAAKGKANVLDAVSCLSAAHCVGFGGTGATDGGGATTMIAGTWNGSAWKLAAVS